ncbi:26133_t:CDS:2, partial [Dentiscutata erythropus]
EAKYHVYTSYQNSERLEYFSFLSSIHRDGCSKKKISNAVIISGK